MDHRRLSLSVFELLALERVDFARVIILSESHDDFFCRVYRENSFTIVCHYEKSSTNNSTLVKGRSPFFTSNLKRVYLLIIVVFRVTGELPASDIRDFSSSS